MVGVDGRGGIAGCADPGCGSGPSRALWRPPHGGLLLGCEDGALALGDAGGRSDRRAGDSADAGRSVWTIVAGKAIYRFDANLEHPSEQAVPIRKTGSRIASRLRRTTRLGRWERRLHVIRYERGHFSVAELAAPAANAGTTRIVSVASDGVVWSAGPRGVSRTDRGRWQYFGKQDGLLADHAVEVQAVQGDQAWVRYDDESRISLLKQGPAATSR